MPPAELRDYVGHVNSAPVEIWRHLKTTVPSPAVLPNITWEWAIPLVVFVLFAACGGLVKLLDYLTKQGVVQHGKKFFSRERELSRSFLPPELEELVRTTRDSFCNVGGRVGMEDAFGRFMCAVNLIDTKSQLHRVPVEPSDLPDVTDSSKGTPFSPTPLKSTVGIEDEKSYLIDLMNLRAGIINSKVLYEYHRKNGSLTYWLFDKKPLLTTAELLRQLDDEERETFVQYCQKLNAAEAARHRAMDGTSDVPKS